MKTRYLYLLLHLLSGFFKKCIYVNYCEMLDPRIPDSRKLPHGYWDLILCPLKEQLVFLTTEPAPQPFAVICMIGFLFFFTFLFICLFYFLRFLL